MSLDKRSKRVRILGSDGFGIQPATSRDDAERSDVTRRVKVPVGEQVEVRSKDLPINQNRAFSELGT